MVSNRSLIDFMSVFMNLESGEVHKLFISIVEHRVVFGVGAN